jgi:bifunctional UDP-N-acetylglucosamine pyrophosphorylase / glucosamine-1-phosphate N-acetyltransferase
MKRVISIILPAPETPFASMLLLGRPCRAYVEQALSDAGTAATGGCGDDASALKAMVTKDVTAVLFALENAPCLNAETYRALLSQGASQPSAVLMHDMKTPLALALPAVTLTALQVKGALSLSAIVNHLDERGEAVKVVHTQNPQAYVTVTDAASFGEAYRYLRAETVGRHIANGVIVLDPERTVIEADVRIGSGTMIYGGNTLQGATVVGAGCTLYPNNRLDSAVLGDGVTAESSVLLHCSVGAHTTVGPFAYLRPDTAVGEGCRIGDYVEIKNSVIGDGTKVSHLTYVGDSDLGKHINLGCGVVFVNYDGKKKYRSTVEDEAFIGCNCNLVAPVRIGKNAYIAAGSTVDCDVPDNALFVARSRGVVKEDWVKRRKEQGKL